MLCGALAPAGAHEAAVWDAIPQVLHTTCDDVVVRHSARYDDLGGVQPHRGGGSAVLRLGRAARPGSEASRLPRVPAGVGGGEAGHRGTPGGPEGA